MNRNITKISRRARLLAQQNHIDLSKVTPTGPDGRVIERDVLRELEKNYLTELAKTPSDSLEICASEESVAVNDSEEKNSETEMEKEISECGVDTGSVNEAEQICEEESAEELPVSEKVESKTEEESVGEELTEKQEPEIETVHAVQEVGQTAIVAAPVKTMTKDIGEKEQTSEPLKQEKESARSYGTEVYRHTDVIIPRTETAPNGTPVTLMMSFDAGEIIKLYNMIKENGETMGVSHITVNDMILFATAKILKKNKALNAHFLGDKIRYFDGVHLGFSVDTDHGIENLTVFDADRLTLTGLAKITDTLIRGARSGKVSSDKNKPSASFMVSDLGALGVEFFTPILKEPQTGILGVCAVQRRLKEVNGKDVAYSCIPLSLTFDPRALGTTSASKFLRDLCTALENFELLLLR